MFRVLINLLIVFLLFSQNVYSLERSIKEKKIGVFFEDLETIGEFSNINYSPEGLFPKAANDFHKKFKISQKEFINIFIKQKGLLDKYPERVMLGMAYFEYFYMQQLKDKKKSIEIYKKKYPDINAATKKNIQQLYSLNKAKKTMRNAVGLSLDDDIEVVLNRYYTLSKLFRQAEISTVKLNKKQNKERKLNYEISKIIGNLKSVSEKKFENRLTDKKFISQYKKFFKKLEKKLKKAKQYKEYELLTSFIIEIDKYKLEENSVLLSGYKIADFVLKNIKKNNIEKKYIQDLSNADFEAFSQKELEALGEVTKAVKKNKRKNSNEIQIQILNLENENIPVNNFLEVYRNELNVKLDSIHLQLASASKMKEWNLSDWANAWKSKIPTKIIDDAGIEINLSPEQIQDIKAQLAIQNFTEMLSLNEFISFIDNDDNFSNLSNILDQQTINDIKFSFTLDDFAKSLDATYGWGINNYDELTALANAQHNANWSVEEYASAYQDNVDIVNALASGNLSSFDAGKIAAAANTSLQDVADTIRAATSAGVSVDLEATAQGLGFSSFAAAVAAYNAQYGTNYSVEEAKESLK